MMWTTRARQATDVNITRRMRLACWLTKATDTHSEYVILLFYDNNGYANAPQCYVMRTLRILSHLHMKFTFYDVPAVSLHVS
jgi:hypothetical protein